MPDQASQLERLKAALADRYCIERQLAEFVARRKAGQLAGRLALALFAFPFIYFLFGMMVVPIVQPHYGGLDFLVIPPLPAILRWTHGIEILADSICYAAALAWLFLPGRERAGEERQAVQERLA